MPALGCDLFEHFDWFLLKHSVVKYLGIGRALVRSCFLLSFHVSLLLLSADIHGYMYGVVEMNRREKQLLLFFICLVWSFL
jgi:hypothetical protein